MPTVSCPNCKQEFDVDADQLGKICMCPKCGVTFTATAPQETHAPNASSEDDVDGDFNKGPSINLDSVNLDEAFNALHTNWRNVIPLGSILSWSNLKKPLVKFCLFLTLFPLLLPVLDLSDDQFLHAIVFYFCMVWLLIFGSYLQTEMKVWLSAIGYMVFTGMIGMPIDYFLQQLPIFNELYEYTDSRNLTTSLLGFCLGVGPIEEFVKLLPLLVFGVRDHKITNERSGLFLGTASGFGFAIVEGVNYMIHHGAVIQLFIRSLSLSFLHAAWCGIIGFVIGSCMRQKFKPAWPFIVAAWIFSAILHGLYDTFTWSPVIKTAIIAIAVTVFVCMLEKAKDTIPTQPQTPPEKPIIE